MEALHGGNVGLGFPEEVSKHLWSSVPLWIIHVMLRRINSAESSFQRFNIMRDHCNPKPLNEII